jgi:predicted secreted protein
MIRHALALTAMSLFACNGCNGDGNTPPATGPTPGVAPNGSASGGVPAAGETLIHAEDDGKTFDVQRGSAVTFKLASNAGTGFQWVPVGVDPNILAQQGDRTQELSSDTPGAPKMEVYHFLANAPGTAMVEMDLKRAFGSQPPGRVIHVTVNVH